MYLISKAISYCNECEIVFSHTHSMLLSENNAQIDVIDCEIYREGACVSMRGKRFPKENDYSL